MAETVATSQALSTDRQACVQAQACLLLGWRWPLGAYWNISPQRVLLSVKITWDILLLYIINSNNHSTQLLLLVHSFSKSCIYNNLVRVSLCPDEKILGDGREVDTGMCAVASQLCNLEWVTRTLHKPDSLYVTQRLKCVFHLCGLALSNYSVNIFN